MGEKEKKKPTKGENIFVLVGTLVIVFLFVKCAYSCGENWSNGSDNPAIGAYIASKDFVRENLKAPSTAKFASFSDSKYEKLSSDKYKVVSYVDSQNSFGAMVREYFICIVRKGSKQWYLEELTFD